MDAVGTGGEAGAGALATIGSAERATVTAGVAGARIGAGGVGCATDGGGGVGVRPVRLRRRRRPLGRRRRGGRAVEPPHRGPGPRFDPYRGTGHGRPRRRCRGGRLRRRHRLRGRRGGLRLLGRRCTQAGGRPGELTGRGAGRAAGAALVVAGAGGGGWWASWPVGGSPIGRRGWGPRRRGRGHRRSRRGRGGCDVRDRRRRGRRWSARRRPRRRGLRGAAADRGSGPRSGGGNAPRSRRPRCRSGRGRGGLRADRVGCRRRWDGGARRLYPFGANGLCGGRRRARRGSTGARDRLLDASTGGGADTEVGGAAG